VRAYTSTTRPPVTSAAPGRSKLSARASRLSASNSGVSAKAPIPTGTLTKKIHSQGLLQGLVEVTALQRVIAGENLLGDRERPIGELGLTI
jgi:hypothetical protein